MRVPVCVRWRKRELRERAEEAERAAATTKVTVAINRLQLPVWEAM
jgi:hypothetical protein